MPNMSVVDELFGSGMWTQTVTVYNGHETEVQNGFSIPSSDESHEVEAIVAHRRSRYWQRIEEGMDSTAEYYMLVRLEEPVEQNDLVDYRGNQYRVCDEEIDPEDEFAIYGLEEVTN